MEKNTYTVLARKWRPKNFDQAFGQLHVIKTLKNAITMKRVAHAYIFSGPRGVGKTSLARIFAKSLNCSKGSSITPCETCQNCKEIMLGKNIDVIEIDGASHRRIDDIREIEEGICFKPSKSPFKIYIIDEVHMLTREAFNALLKTLEEPPSHAKFIFATTEPAKIPDTIHSRCQTFSFRFLEHKDIIDNLTMILTKEEIPFKETVLHDVARASKGSLRDAQSLLDQLISFSNEELSSENLESILGLVGHDRLPLFTEYIANNDYTKTLQMIQEMAKQGKNLHQFTLSLIEYFRDLTVLKVSKNNDTSLINMSSEEALLAKKCEKLFTLEKLLYMIQILIKTEEQMKKMELPRLALEISVIKLIHVGDMTSLKNLLKSSPQSTSPSKHTLSKKLGDPVNKTSCAQPQKENSLTQSAYPTLTESKNQLASKKRPDTSDKLADTPATYKDSQEESFFENKVLDKLWKESKKSKMTLSVALQKVHLFDLSTETLSLTFLAKDDFYGKKLLREKPWIESQLALLTDKKIILEIKTSTDEQKSNPKEKKKTISTEKSPLKKNKTGDLSKNPIVTKFVEAFDGKIVDIDNNRSI